MNSGGLSGCACVKASGYGAVCANSVICGTGYFCHIPVTWPGGYCTRSCQKDIDCVGGPAGTLALCRVVTTTPFGDIKYCRFVCGTYSKPCRNCR